MKIGPRKPNIKKSIKARTTGKLKRQVKSSINPTYGKKGVGWVKNPKKATYNKVYNKTTFGIDNTIKDSSKRSKNDTCNKKTYNIANGTDIDYLDCDNIYEKESININNSNLPIFELVFYSIKLFLGLILILFCSIAIGAILYFIF